MTAHDNQVDQSSVSVQEPSQQPMAQKKEWIANPFLREVVTLAMLIALIVVLRSSVFNFYIIPTGSMIPTIKINDRVFANKLSYGLMLPFAEKQIVSWNQPQRGDIILFKSPKEDQTFVKRVIGVGGDRVSFKEGHLYINNTPVVEEEQTDRSILADQDENVASNVLYTEKGLAGDTKQPAHYILRGRFGGTTYNETRVFNVPEGKLLCMGDNRDGSSDSRFWGYVDADKVYGKALFIFFSTVDPRVDNSNSFLPKFRWDRTFQPLR